jgi:hypothetical protein
MNRLLLALSMRPAASLPIVLFLALSVLLAGLPHEALADGRVFNPKRLRVKADQASRGRTLKDVRVPSPDPRQPLKPRAEIPNPEPRRRGGSGYARKGRYFYQKPKPIRAAGSKRGSVERVNIPPPDEGR